LAPLIERFTFGGYMKRQLISMLVGSCGLASAMIYDGNYPCGSFDTCCGNPCGKFEFWGDALYLKPSSCNFDFAVNDHVLKSFPYGKERGVQPKYQWGFRVGAAYCFPCSEADVNLYYTRLTTSDRRATIPIGYEELWTSSTVAGFTPPTLENNSVKALAFAKVNSQWNAFDAEIGYNMLTDCRFSARGHIGLHFADIKLDRLVVYKGSAPGAVTYSGPYISHSKTWGVGPRFGSDFRYDVGCGLGIVARAGFGVLAGEIKHRDYARATTKVTTWPTPDDMLTSTCNASFAISNKTRAVVFPEFDTSLGVNYTLCLNRCLEASFEAGWEFRTYLQSVVHAYYQDYTAPASTATVCDPFNLQGLYLRGLLRF
jgi:Legionella pneumophila major outer membrane protein precursor